MAVTVDDYTLSAICQYLNENYPQFGEMKTSSIVSFRVEDSTIIILVDCGIKGTPKFRIPFEELEPEVEPEPEVEVILPTAETGETVLEIAKKTPVKIEYIDLEEKEVKPKARKEPANGRRKRGKK